MKIKSISIVLFMLFMTMCVNSQNLTESQSLSASGRHALNSWYFDWNLGQTITETFSNSAITVQSGFYTVNNSNVAVPELTNNFQFHIYPNPFSDFIFIQHPDNTSKWMIKIIDCNGKTLLNKSIENCTKLDLQFLPAGIYLLNIVQENSNFKKSYKILKN